MRNLSEMDTEVLYLPYANFQSSTPQTFSSRVQVDFGAVSDKGKVRPNNEDAFLILRTGRYMQKVADQPGSELIPRAA